MPNVSNKFQKIAVVEKFVVYDTVVIAKFSLETCIFLFYTNFEGLNMSPIQGATGFSEQINDRFQTGTDA